MDTVVVSVQLSKYRATVHYESCPHYSSLYHHSKLAIPPSVKWKLCYWCRPSAEDIAKVAPEITWLEKTAEVMNLSSGMLLTLTDGIESHMARKENDGRGMLVRDKY